MTHAEFIEKYNEWEPEYKAYKAGKSKQDIATSKQVLPLVVGTMLRFVDNNSAIPRCEWLGDLNQSAVIGLLSKIRVTPLKAMREDLIKHCQVTPEGNLAPNKSWMHSGVLRRVLAKSGLSWYDLDGKPCVHWKEKA